MLARIARTAIEVNTALSISAGDLLGNRTVMASSWKCYNFGASRNIFDCRGSSGQVDHDDGVTNAASVRLNNGAPSLAAQLKPGKLLANELACRSPKEH
jgi:hypothetical protein